MTVHLMIDIETMGTQINAAVLSIAAVQFYPVSTEEESEQVEKDRFYEKIDPVCYKNTRNCFSMDVETIKWWTKQKTEVMQEAWSGTNNIEKVINDLLLWINSKCSNKRDLRVWSHGKEFDLPILENVIRFVGQNVPWSMINTRDTRTIYDIPILRVFPEFIDGDEFPPHHPVGDCLSQIRALRHAFQEISTQKV